MAGVNKVILLGNLGADPEVRHTKDGSVVANVGIATTEKYKDRDGNQKELTEWHNLEMWGKTGEIAEKYLKKGDQIYIEGKIKTDTWQDESGASRKNVKVRVLAMTMLRKSNHDQSPPPQSTPPPTQEADGVDDLPF